MIFSPEQSFHQLSIQAVVSPPLGYNSTVALILAITLGLFGVHLFYLGYNRQALARLISTALAFTSFALLKMLLSQKLTILNFTLIALLLIIGLTFLASSAINTLIEICQIKNDKLKPNGAEGYANRQKVSL